MKENSSSDNQNIKSTKRLEYIELQIESRNDIENLGKIEILQQYKPQFSWELYNSEISEQEIENEQNTINHELLPEKNEPKKQSSKEENLIEQSKENKAGKESQAKQKQFDQKKNEDKNCYGLNKVSQRELQILHNKQLSNLIYLKTQIQQLLRLTAFSIFLEEEQFLRDRIYKINAQIRKLKIRSISKKRIEKQVKQDDRIKKQQRVEQLTEAVKNMKLKTSKLSTKLILLDNYLKVKQRKSKNKHRFHKRSQSTHEVQLAKSPVGSYQDIEDITSNRVKKGSQKFISQYENSYLLQDLKQTYFPRRKLFLKKRQESCPISLLKQHMQIIKQNLSDQKEYIRKKIQLLQKEKINLKRQVEFVKFDILKLQNQIRRFRAVSGNSLRKISKSQSESGARSFSSQNLLKLSRLSRKNPAQKIESLEKAEIGQNSLKTKKSKMKTEPNPSQSSQLLEELPKNVFLSGEQNFLSPNSSKYEGSTKLNQNKNNLSEEIRKQYFNI